MSMQQDIIHTLQVKPEIDVEAEIRKRIDFLKEYCIKSHSRGFVLGISGGQDSTLAGRLSQLAAEELRAEGRDATFIAIRLPHGSQQDEEDAQAALDFITPDRLVTFNIKDPVSAFAEQFGEAFGSPLSDFNKGNVKARMRMIAQYAVAGETGCLVVGTDHAAEAITGFFTKFGDGGADLLPISGLTKGQGRELLQHLGASDRLYLKVPTADLLDMKPQQADETELGLSYALLDQYLTGQEVEPQAKESIEKRYLQTRHKRELPVTPSDDWWKE